MMGTTAEFFESDDFHGLVEQAVRCRQALATAVLNGCIKHSEQAVQPKWARRKKGERRPTDYPKIKAMEKRIFTENGDFEGA